MESRGRIPPHLPWESMTAKDLSIKGSGKDGFWELDGEGGNGFDPKPPILIKDTLRDQFFTGQPYQCLGKGFGLLGFGQSTGCD